MLSQIVVKSVHLTGRTGEQHRPPPIQLPPHLLIDAGDVALNGLGSPDAGQVLLALYRFMADPQLGVHPGTEHHAAALQHIVRQQGEYTPAGGVLPHGIVGVPCGKTAGSGWASRWRSTGQMWVQWPHWMQASVTVG